MNTTPPDAASVFGPTLDLAEKYVDFLADAGLERGLLGPREADRLWSRHVLNCTAVASAISEDKGASEGQTITDIGSGAGLPGIPLALVRPDLRIRLVEPLLRRSTFLEEAIDLLGLRSRGIDIVVVRGRAEEPEVVSHVGGSDYVTARAVAPLGKLARWCVPLLRPGGRFVALKGESAAVELERDRADAEKAGLTDLESRVVEVPGADPTYLVLGTSVGTRSRRGSSVPRDKLGSSRRRR